MYWHLWELSGRIKRNYRIEFSWLRNLWSNRANTYEKHMRIRTGSVLALQNTAWKFMRKRQSGWMSRKRGDNLPAGLYKAQASQHSLRLWRGGGVCWESWPGAGSSQRFSWGTRVWASQWWRPHCSNQLLMRNWLFDARRGCWGGTST